jgi:hypothetical protein
MFHEDKRNLKKKDILTLFFFSNLKARCMMISPYRLRSPIGTTYSALSFDVYHLVEQDTTSKVPAVSPTVPSQIYSILYLH